MAKTYANGVRDTMLGELDKRLTRFETTLDLRFEKFKDDLKEVFVTKESLNQCLEEKITGTPLDNRKARWQKAGIWIAIIFGALGFLTSMINILRPR